MTAMDNPAPSQRRKAGVQRMIKHHVKIDMTPMVDLGFLLITFFVITTELTKPTAMNLYMPKDGGPPTELGASNALTVLLEKDKLYCYHGDWKDAIASGNIIETNFRGNADLRKIINDKQQLLDSTQKNKEGRNGLMVLINPGKDVSYNHIVNVLDEMTISMVKKYALVKITNDEKEWLAKNMDKQ
jgi:biopolymer transport protein ExbD